MQTPSEASSVKTSKALTIGDDVNTLTAPVLFPIPKLLKRMKVKQKIEKRFHYSLLTQQSGYQQRQIVCHRIQLDIWSATSLSGPPFFFTLKPHTDEDDVRLIRV